MQPVSFGWLHSVFGANSHKNQQKADMNLVHRCLPGRNQECSSKVWREWKNGRRYLKITRTAFAWTWGALILLSVIDTAMIFYAAHTKLESLEDYLKRWSSVSINHRVSGRGHGKVVRLAAISFLISSKKTQCKEPHLMEEVQRLPKGLKFWATYPFHIAYFVMGTSTILWLYGKYSGLFN